MPRNVYPVRVGFIERLDEYYPVERLASSLGVPGYADEKIYNYILLGFWRCEDQPTGAALAWSKPIDYFGDDSVFGKNKQEIQQNLHNKYNTSRSHVLVSAFGPREMPTSLGLSPLDCANKLATFVLDNNLDGADVNWQDEEALHMGKGLDWIISFHTHLRKLLPSYIITHSPFASYFRSEDYSSKSYTEINNKINNTVNFYNVQYFNLGTSKFNSYEEIFKKSTGDYQKVAVAELTNRGVDLNKIVIAKPAVPSDTIGSGFMDLALLGSCLSQAYNEAKWFAGVAIWQYASDIRGRGMTSAATKLKDLCTANKDCK